MVPDHVQVEPHWDRDASLSEVLDEIIISELGEDPGFDLDSWTSVPRLKLGLASYLEIVDWLSEVMFYKYSIKILLFLSIQIIQRQTLYLVDIDHHFGDIILKSNFSIYGTRSLYLLVGLVGLIYSFLAFVRELRVLKLLSSQSCLSTGILGQTRDLETPRTEASDIWCAVMGFSGRFCEIVDVIVFSYLASFHLELSQAILLLLVRLSFLAIQLRSLLAVGNISSGFVQSQHPRPGSAQSSALSFRSTTSQDEERIGLSVEIDTESARQHQPSHPPRESPSTARLQSLLADYQDTFVLSRMSQTFFSKGLGFYAHPGFSRAPGQDEALQGPPACGPGVLPGHAFSGKRSEPSIHH
ncbi:hypothetical protein OIY81_2316 [Cryptosporidium canis]|uniref:Uncharacterized protein n=1 Tax=Cryptosporidium canis TaxID=195482 RepID=A0ABQ8PBR0_9CRYT|nr:hypothetical protein OIY81_2316 [Cryptosporidium canis]KAJ1615415.1 hypothetical protein OJ252_147 [Cryptosporidium canis]